MKRTINIHTWYYASWEIFRCVIAVIYIIAAATVPTLIGHMMAPWVLTLTFWVMDFFCYLDLYIRMHCQYYNKKGILVSHPLYTAKHYIATSFYVDLISFIPIVNLKIDEILGKRNETVVLICSMLVTRLLQLHRPLSGLSYLENKYKGKRGLAMHMFKYLILVIVGIMYCQTIAMLILCRSRDEKLYCSDEQPYLYLKNFIEYFYTISTFFTVATTGSRIGSFNEGMVMMFAIIPITILRWAFMVSIASKAVSLNTILVTFIDSPIRLGEITNSF